MLMGRFCLKLLTLPPRLQHWESVGVISSGYCPLEKEKPWSQTPVGGKASGDMLWLQHRAAAPLDTQRSPCPLRLATEGNKAIYIISIYMAKLNFHEFRSFHKHRWQRNTKLVAERDVPISATCLSCPTPEWVVRDRSLWKEL